MAKQAKPPAPEGLGTEGRKIWAWVTDTWDLDPHEESLLRQACRTADLCERLEAEVAAGKVVKQTPQGERANVAGVELRQQRLVLARLIAALRLPTGLDESNPARQRAQRRGIRGVYTNLGA